MCTVTNSIISIFDKYRMEPTAADQYESTGKQVLAGLVDKAASTNQPLRFAMLGLPFKSTNTRDKVLGDLPDLGEELTIKNFENFNNEIKQVYTPGAIIRVASDGFMFNDILGVHEAVVDAYKRITNDYRTDSTVDIIDINDFFTGKSTASNREKIMRQFGFDWVQMEQEILFNPDVNMLYKGMIRFMEEEVADKPFESNNQRHKQAKRLAREMMLRNEAYNRLVRHELNDHIRITMHQSLNNGYKYSFKLIPGTHTQHSPWHSAIVMNGSEAITMHRKDAEAAGYQLVHKGKQPYNYITV